MFGTFALTALFVSVLSVLADDAPAPTPVPIVPGPNVTYQVGGDCITQWTGNESATAWQDMTIQFMTGDNLHMIPLTTVATKQDGTVNGTFTHKCPEVNPYSAIYFYQYTAPNAPNATPLWTTRFAIADANGQTTPPPNLTQPDPNNTPIPWGAGSLVNPSSEEPPSSSGSPSASITQTVTPTSTGISASDISSDTGAQTDTTTPATSTSEPIGASGANSHGRHHCNCGCDGASSSTSRFKVLRRTPTPSTSISPLSQPTGTSLDSKANTVGNGAVALDSQVWKAATTTLGVVAMAIYFIL